MLPQQPMGRVPGQPQPAGTPQAAGGLMPGMPGFQGGMPRGMGNPQMMQQQLQAQALRQPQPMGGMPPQGGNFSFGQRPQMRPSQPPLQSGGGFNGGGVSMPLQQNPTAPMQYRG